MKLLAKTVKNSNGTIQFEIKYNDRPYRVKLFKFQENYPDDTPIECLMIQQTNGELYFRQDLHALISEYYTPGKDYDFEVKHDFSHNGYYELVDERGIPFRLPVPKGVKLLTGAKVTCRLIGINKSGGQLVLQDSNIPNYENPSQNKSQDYSRPSTYKEIDAKSIADRVYSDLFPEEDPLWDPDQIFSLLFINDDYYSQSISSQLLDIILKWKNNENLEWDAIHQRLIEIKKSVMYILEGTDLLLDLDSFQRKSLQNRLTILTDNIFGYLSATEALRSGESTASVERVLNCLRTSGYIYNAELHLDIMMKLFALSSEVMVSSMNEIFSIIHSRTEDFWHDEPFRKAFIRLLQMYLDQSHRSFESKLLNDMTTVRSFIEALSIQLLLAQPDSDGDLFDYNLNLASLYRYSSMLRTSVPDNAIRNGFLALMDVTRKPGAVYRWSETGAHDLIASKLTAAPVGLEDHFEKTYECLPVSLKISPERIVLTRTDVHPESLKTLDLSDVGIWGNILFRTPQKIALIKNTNDLKRAKDMWNAIEMSLFSEEVIIPQNHPKNQIIPQKGEICSIRVTSQIDPTTFAVEVTDERFRGKGTIHTSDMVQYKIPNLHIRHFCDEEGYPLIFKAIVTGFDENGLSFTIQERLIKFSQEEIKNDNPMHCIIKSSNQYGKVGISEWGDAVKFKPLDDFAGVKAGDVVLGNFWSIPSNPKERNYIEGVIVELVDDPDPFDTAEAFHALLSDYADDIYDVEPESTASEPNESDGSAEMLTDARMAELMALVERKATSENNYIKAYNNIGFARLLARMTRDDNRRRLYEAWMRLIAILHHFALNGMIDQAQLRDFEANDRSTFDTGSELYRRYLQLKIVSYKGKPGMQEEIWKYMSHNDEEIRSLASNIMAYNLIAVNASASALGEIDDRINNILHVRARTSTLHSFGSENKTTEFKSSLIFPPENNMRANPEVQTLEIMKEICAFLNADGGKLYLGVNDFGMGVGIENDLAYKDFNGSEDKYDRYFRLSVCRILGRDADAYIDAEFKDFGGKKIYIVTVQPYYTGPVKVEGIIYERHGSSKLPLYDPEEIKLFTERRIEQRERIKLQTVKVSEPQTETKPVEASVTSSAIPAQNPKKEKRLNTDEAARALNGIGSQIETNPEKISTRAGRNQCPASYDPDHDPSTVRYLEIRDEQFQLIPEFYGYSNTDSDLQLVLPLTKENAKDWLILAYEDGTVCKISLKPIFDRQDYTPWQRYTGAKVLFADIVNNDEALITISQNVNGNWNARADHTEEIPEAAINRSMGERMFNTQREKYLFNIISAAESKNFTDLFNRTYKDVGRGFANASHDKLYQQLKKAGYIDNTI